MSVKCRNFDGILTEVWKRFNVTNELITFTDTKNIYSNETNLNLTWKFFFFSV